MNRAVPFFVLSCIACGGRLPSDPPTDAGSNDAELTDASDERGDAHDLDTDDAATIEDPLAHCPPGRNVLYMNIEGPLATLLLGERTYTDGDADWTLRTSPEMDLTVKSLKDGISAEVTVSTSRAKPVPGTYPQGASAGSNGPWFGAFLDGEGCAVDSGTLTVVEFQLSGSDGGGGGQTITLWFDVQCRNTVPSDRLRGCVRYAQ